MVFDFSSKITDSLHIYFLLNPQLNHTHFNKHHYILSLYINEELH